MKNILVINGNPSKDSLSTSLTEAYEHGLKKAKAVYNILNLAELKFNPILQHGYKKRTELEPDLLKAQELIKAADHLVFVFPTWWGTFPTLLQGFIERVFLPGFSFKYRENSLFWDKLLTGKTARLIITMDAPSFYYKLIYRSPGVNAMKRAILNFCGVKPVRSTIFGPVKSANDKKIGTWIAKVEHLGEKLG